MTAARRARPTSSSTFCFAASAIPICTPRDEWGGTTYPVVPGHEIVGKITAVGSDVKKFKVGDIAGVGCLVDSCRSCTACKEGLENYCEKGMTFTYNSADPQMPGKQTYGGYSKQIVVEERFVLHIPKNLDLAATAPLLCAGITTYSPMKHWNVGPGMKIGVVGLGGLGHMGVKFSHAFGAKTVLFTTSPDKIADGKRLGADEVIISKDPAAMEKQAATFDFILNTVAAPHNLDPFINALKLNGTMCLVGAPDSPHPSPQVFPFIFKRRSLAGSLIGGLPETQEMLNYCGEKNIVCDIEKIRMDEINTAYQRMLKGDVKYRFVIDNAAMK